jgi:malonyl-CoA O-methyltransferase
MLSQRPRGFTDRLRRRLRGAADAFAAADAGQLPIADGAVDLVFSNLMLHWHPMPHALFPEWKRVLRTDGLLLFSCFGPDTLKELRSACRTSLPRAQPMPFIDMHDFGDMMLAAGFADPVMDAEVLTLTYRSARDLVSEVRALGGNPRDDRPPGLPSGRQARGLLDALAARRCDDGRIRLTFEVAYGHAWKPAPRVERPAAVPMEAVRAELAKRRRPPH